MWNQLKSVEKSQIKGYNYLKVGKITLIIYFM